MSIKELYTKGTKVWLPDPVNVWQCATLLDDFRDQKELYVRLESGKDVRVKVKSSDELPPLRNPEVLIGENDLTSLSYLHEPAVLHNLQTRFCERNYIYTYCGIVLVAFNPYQQLPIYDNGTIRAYSGQDMASMDPHIFAIAEEAFKRMSRFEENQSIIVSGESGAGKTVSAKYAMRYFATVCGAEDETQIEKRVLATNPIMEAIGNAKTTRNDNSSRFGKYIEIGFGRNEHILGANMRTYLLEKSRVVFQAPDERNYHVFYQLCSVADDEAFKQYYLDSSDEFFYTNQGSSSTVNSISDSEDFLSFCQALNVLGLNPMKQSQIFRILAGILHLGNIELKENEKSTDASFVNEKDKHMSICSKLFGVDQDQLRFWLCNKKMITVNETLSVPLTVSQAAFSRDALAKHIYSSLFLWIVSQLNKSLSPSSKMSRFIGVLDIYGFETFEINSFEQFCINYANEKLQQQFCLHVFKLEQEEYVREQIEWSFIDFHDNQPCIDLIENKLGILDLLDEECKMVNGSDGNWCRKLYDKHMKHKHFSKPRMSETSFIIHHFADNVEYQIHGFLEKNRDRVLEEHIKIFKASEYELIAEMFQDNHHHQSSSSSGTSSLKSPQTRSVPIRPAGGKESQRPFQQIKQHSKTVGSQFSESLGFLMETLFSTTPHYVRCIKPNDSKLPFTFDPIRTVNQLRACGVLETIRISAAGYPSRWTYADFFKRYRVLATSKEIVKPDVRKTCENLLGKLIKEKDRFQFGKTKIFFRAGQVAYLEKLRSEKLKKCSIVMQKVVRGWLARRRYKKIQTMVRNVQKFGRGILARRKAELIRKTKAATKIRAAWIGHRQRKKYLKMKKSLITIQSCARGLLGKKNFHNLTTTMRVATIQRCIRGWLCRRKYRRVVRGVTKMQGLVRRMIAKRKVKMLKVEAKDVYLVKTKGLENKIIELQQKLDEKAREVNNLKEDQEMNNELKAEVQKLRGAKQSNTYMVNQISELERQIMELLGQLEELKKDKEKILMEKEAIKKEKNDLINNLNKEREMLKEQLEIISQELKAHVENQEDATRKRIEEATLTLNHEIEMERANHQRLIKDHNRLQQRLDNLQSDNTVYLGTPRAKRHRRTPSNLSDFSLESESSLGDRNDMDSGYGYPKKKDNLTHAYDETDLTRVNEAVYPLEKKDISLVIKLQAKLKELEKENRKYRDDLNRRDFPCQDVIFNLSNLPLANVFEAFKIQEQEIENASLRNQLSRLQKVLTESASNYDVRGGKTKQLYDHFESLKEELKYKHNEVARLKTLLFKSQQQQEQNNSNNANNYGDSQPASGDKPSAASGNGSLPEAAPLNEDGELNLAYESQKKLNQLLEAELQRIQEISQLRDQDLLAQIDALNKDNKKQLKIIEENLEQSTEAKVVNSVLFELAKITSENVNLHEFINSLQDMNKKLRKAVRIYSKRLRGSEVNEANLELERELAMDDNMPLVKYHQQREWMGMLEYKKEDEHLLLRNLILDLKPEMMLKEMPQLPSYLLLMCIRHTDYMNDDEKVRGLLTNSINGIKKIVKKSSSDLGRVSAWLSNSVRLLNNLKQYSGEKAFQSENTQKQNEQCLKNFDLSEYRLILNDLAVWIYQVAVKYAESKLQNLIVGAILEKECIAGCSTGKPTSMRQVSVVADNSDEKREYSPDDIIKIMNDVMQHLSAHNVQFDVVRQIFKQIFFFISATALNTLLLRKDLCHWMKAVQIRYNLSQLEQWVRDNKLNDGGIEEPLEPLIQATQLLQARKTEADVDSLCDVCSKLNMSQIIKILNLYTPVNEFEERVPMSFIRKVQEKMSASSASDAAQQSLMMDTKFLFAVSFEFKSSNVAIEQLNPPMAWGLGFLKKL